jgi:replicative DNA helicase
MEPIRKLEIPIDVDNEASILSNVIKNGKHRDLFTKMINHLDFRYKENQVLAWTLQEMQRSNLVCDIDTILIKAISCPVKFKVDYEFVSQVIQNFAELPENNFREHLTKLKTDKVKEELSAFYFKSIYAACLDPHVQISQLETRINFAKDIIQRNGSTGASQFIGLDVMVDNFIAGKGAASNFRSTGFPALDDKLTDGYKAKGITVLCGLPGMGKSSFLLSSMYNLSNVGVWCPQFALEMDSQGLTTKLAAYSSGISVKKIAKEWNNFTDRERKLIDYELERLKKNPYILCNDTPGQSLQSIREQIMILQDRLKPKDDYMFVSIDLFGKIKEFQTSDNFARNYEQELNKTQVMAKEMNVNLGLVAQINRAVMQRKFTRPKMSDLKNAGAWEEVADLILGMHRPNYDPEVALQKQIDDGYAGDSYSSNEEDANPDDGYLDFEDPTILEKNMAEVIVMKQRMGEGNTITNCIFDPNTTRYVPVAQKDQMYVNLSKKSLTAV